MKPGIVDVEVKDVETLAQAYQHEIQRSEHWRLLYQGASDTCDLLEEEVRKARKRIKLLETSIEKAANEGS